jgi:hypothetical protein
MNVNILLSSVGLVIGVIWASRTVFKDALECSTFSYFGTAILCGASLAGIVAELALRN